MHTMTMYCTLTQKPCCLPFTASVDLIDLPCDIFRFFHFVFYIFLFCFVFNILYIEHLFLYMQSNGPNGCCFKVLIDNNK